MSELKKAIMYRDEVSSEEADSTIDEIREEINSYLNENDLSGAYEVLGEYGLEPDYLMDLF